MINEILESTMTVKLDDEILFGVNEECNDKTIGYSSLKKSFYTLAKVDDYYVLVAVSLRTGNVVITSFRGQPQTVMRSNQIFREINMLNAFKNLNLVFNMLYEIIEQKKVKIKHLNFLSPSDRTTRFIKRLFISAPFKMMILRFMFIDNGMDENETFKRFKFIKKGIT